MSILVLAFACIALIDWAPPHADLRSHFQQKSTGGEDVSVERKNVLSFLGLPSKERSCSVSIRRDMTHEWHDLDRAASHKVLEILTVSKDLVFDDPALLTAPQLPPPWIKFQMRIICDEHQYLLNVGLADSCLRISMYADMRGAFECPEWNALLQLVNAELGG